MCQAFFWYLFLVLYDAKTAFLRQKRGFEAFWSVMKSVVGTTNDTFSVEERGGLRRPIPTAAVCGENSSRLERRRVGDAPVYADSDSSSTPRPSAIRLTNAKEAATWWTPVVVWSSG